MSEVQAPAVVEDKPQWVDFKIKRHPLLKEEFEVINYQGFSVYKGLTQKGFILGLPTGSGKTFCAYLMYMYWRAKYPDGILVILTDKSSVVQFSKELHKFFKTQYKIIPIDSKGMQKISGQSMAATRRLTYARLCENHFDGISMTYSTFLRDWDSSLGPELNKAVAKGKKIFVMYDEATAFKNIKTKTHECVEKLSLMSDRVLSLTATMTKGKIEEIYGIYHGMGIQLASSRAQFMSEFCIVRNSKYSYIEKVDGYKNIEKFVKLISPICVMFRKADIAPWLPSFVLRKEYVEHDKEQIEVIHRIYDGIIKFDRLDQDAIQESFTTEDGVEVLESNSGFIRPDDTKEVQSLTEVGYVRQALLDPRLVTQPDRDSALSAMDDYRSPKTLRLIHLLSNEFVDEKIIVYTSSRKYLNILERIIKKCEDLPKGYQNVMSVHGGVTSSQEREKIKDTFSNSPNHNLLLLNDAGIRALNLQASGTTIVMNMPKSGGDLIQLAGRTSRIDTKRDQLNMIYILTEESQDEDEYMIINQQMVIVSSVQGESEKGLIDWDMLKECNAVNDDEIAKKGKDTLILAQRSRRKTFYSRQLLGKN